ncbi:MAG: hypothetical protein ACTIKC_01805 [Psychrobacter sp.]
MKNNNWETDADVYIGDDAFIVIYFEAIGINNAQDAWQSVMIENKNIVLLRNELDKIIKRLEIE